MKKLMSFAALSAFIFLLNSCIPSIHPLYTKDKLVMVKELPGTWINGPADYSFSKKQKVMGEEKDVNITVYNNGEQPEIWKFEQLEDKEYRLIHTDSDGRRAAFEIFVIRLGKHYFIDFYPKDMPSEETGNGNNFFGKNNSMNSLQATHLWPVHTFAKLEVTQNQLKISMFDPDFLKKLLENQQIRIKHEKTENGYVLTASSQELQKFVEKYADVREAYLSGDPITLNKSL